jgi:hypothetical protein
MLTLGQGDGEGKTNGRVLELQCRRGLKRSGVGQSNSDRIGWEFRREGRPARALRDFMRGADPSSLGGAWE